LLLNKRQQGWEVSALLAILYLAESSPYFSLFCAERER